jgi:hypothetical protein
VRPRLEPLERRGHRAQCRRGAVALTPHALGQRRAGEEVDDVVLAEVDQREASVAA